MELLYSDPESLLELFTDLDFLSLAANDQKPCFKTKTYSNSNSYVSSFYRYMNGESISSNGITKMESIVKRTKEHYLIHGSDKHNINILLNKIQGAITGLKKIANTYETIGKYSDALKIRNNIIVPLQKILVDDPVFSKKIRVNNLVQIEEKNEDIEEDDIEEDDDT